jgi:hypothetical protein
LRHSSSSRDVTSAFYYLKEIWTQLGWNEFANNGTVLIAAVKVSYVNKAGVVSYITKAFKISFVT